MQGCISFSSEQLTHLPTGQTRIGKFGQELLQILGWHLQAINRHKWRYTPEVSQLSPENGGWKTTFLLGKLLFRGYLKLSIGYAQLIEAISIYIFCTGAYTLTCIFTFTFGTSKTNWWLSVSCGAHVFKTKFALSFIQNGCLKQPFWIKNSLQYLSCPLNTPNTFPQSQGQNHWPFLGMWSWNVLKGSCRLYIQVCWRVTYWMDSQSIWFVQNRGCTTEKRVCSTCRFCTSCVCQSTACIFVFVQTLNHNTPSSSPPACAVCIHTSYNIWSYMYIMTGGPPGPESQKRGLRILHQTGDSVGTPCIHQICFLDQLPLYRFQWLGSLQ